MNSASLQAVLFDMDGTLVDNMAYHISSWEAFCQQYNLAFSLESWHQNLNGRNSRDTLQLLFGRQLNDQEVHRFTEEKEEIYRALYRPHLEPIAGIVALLQDLRTSGVALAVATSAPLSNVDFTLRGAGIDSFFSVVVSGGMVKKGKPDPEIYRITADKLGAEPAGCLVFEDALLGIESARQAGMTVVALTTSHPAEDLANLTALQLPDFKSVNFEKLNRLLTEKKCPD